MSGALEPLHHAWSCSHRRYKGGPAIARSELPHVRPMALSSRSLRTPLVFPTNLILPLGKPDGCTTVSLLAADTAGATHKSP